MTAANLGVIYATGCQWANLPRRAALVVDMDLEAPGVQFYNFASTIQQCLQLPFCGYHARGERFETHLELDQWIRSQDDFGLLHWLQEITNHPNINRIISRARQASRGPVYLSAALITELRAAVFDLIRTGPLDGIIVPSSHLIEVVDSTGRALLHLLPPGEPNQHRYQELLKQFDWRRFFEEQAGVAILSALYGWLMREKQEKNGVGIERILLDQNAGDTWASVANRSVAHNRVLVTGFNLQNQEGLLSLLGEGSGGDISDVRVVLSQYKGRPLDSVDRQEPISGTSVLPIMSRKMFLESESQRDRLIGLLGNERGIEAKNIFLVDFVVDAIQREHFHAEDSPSWNELVRLLVSIERPDPYVGKHNAVGNLSEIRVLGEFVGVDENKPSGPIESFRLWLTQQVEATVNVTGIATGHEQIASLIVDGKPIPYRNDGGSFPKNKLGVVRSSDGNSMEGLTLNDFDLVALPAYLITHTLDNLERLVTEGFGAGAEDRLGPINVEYLRQSILGFDRYAFHDNGTKRELIGYPLFVDLALLVVNRKKIKESFEGQYFEAEQRRFRGFLDPADVLAAARAAHKDNVPKNRMIMTLRKHIAQWYEWQTIISIFDTIDFDVKDPWEDISQTISQLTSPKTVRATRFYLELSSYAERISESADWDKAIKFFYEEQQVGMAFIFPDAIPREYREIDSGSDFVYTAPPCDRHPEECWLLVIPKDRRTGAPSKNQLQDLLSHFMAVENQKEYQRLGGMTSHKRAIECVDLWHCSPYLPHLTSLMNEDAVFVRTCSAQARRLAVEIVEVLDNLREFVHKELLREAHGISPDYLWHKEDFTHKVEEEIRRRFESIAVESLKEA